LILKLNLIRSRYHLIFLFVIVLMITTAEDDDDLVSWASKEKKYLLAGIVNPANFYK
jgi:hypothetical protein